MLDSRCEPRHLRRRSELDAGITARYRCEANTSGATHNLCDRPFSSVINSVSRPTSHIFWKLVSGQFMANVKTLPNLQALSISPSPAQTLPSEAVLDALKMMLIGASLNEVLTSITRLIEAHSEGMLRTKQRPMERASVLTSDRAAQPLTFGSQSLCPTFFLIRIGPTSEALFCGVGCGPLGQPPSCRTMAKYSARFVCTIAKFGIRRRTTFS
jgi:hypothetical protein